MIMIMIMIRHVLAQVTVTLHLIVVQPCSNQGKDRTTAWLVHSCTVPSKPIV